MARKRRRKWRAPNNPTVQARIIWRAVYEEPWPTGWKVEWVGFMRGATGLCEWGRRRILLSHGDAVRPDRHPTTEQTYQNALARAFWLAHSTDYDREFYYPRYAAYCSKLRLELERHRDLPRGALETLIHEFVHVRNPKLKRGREFDRLVRWGWDRLSQVRITCPEVA